LAVFGSVETELVAEVVIPVAGFAETDAFVAIAAIAFEAVAPDVPVADEPVAKSVDDGTPFEVPAEAVCAETTDDQDGWVGYKAEVPTGVVVMSEADAFAECATVFAGKEGPSSARRELPVDNSENTQKTNQAHPARKRRCEKSEHFSRFFITTPPPFRRR
jgi:hypothetical protein